MSPAAARGLTAMELRLFPVARVDAGAAYFAPGRAADVLARYRTWIDRAPDELSTAVRTLRARTRRASRRPSAGGASWLSWR